MSSSKCTSESSSKPGSRSPSNSSPSSPPPQKESAPPKRSLFQGGYQRFCSSLVLLSFLFQTLWPSVAFSMDDPAEAIDSPLPASRRSVFKARAFDKTPGDQFQGDPSLGSKTPGDDPSDLKGRKPVIRSLSLPLNPLAEGLNDVPTLILPSFDTQGEDFDKKEPALLAAFQLKDLKDEAAFETFQKEHSLYRDLVRIQQEQDEKEIGSLLWSAYGMQFVLFANGELSVIGDGDPLRPSPSVLRITNPNGHLHLCENLSFNHLLVKASSVSHTGLNTDIKQLDVWATGKGDSKEKAGGLFVNKLDSTLTSQILTVHEGAFQNQGQLSGLRKLQVQSGVNRGPVLSKDLTLIIEELLTNEGGGSFFLETLETKGAGTFQQNGFLNVRSLLIDNASFFEQSGIDRSFESVEIGPNVQRWLHGKGATWTIEDLTLYGRDFGTRNKKQRVLLINEANLILADFTNYAGLFQNQGSVQTKRLRQYGDSLINDETGFFDITQEAELGDDTKPLTLINKGNFDLQGKSIGTIRHLDNYGGFFLEGEHRFKGDILENHNAFRFLKSASSLFEWQGALFINHKKMTLCNASIAASNSFFNHQTLITELPCSLKGDHFANQGTVEAKDAFSFEGKHFTDSKTSKLTAKGFLTLQTKNPLSLKGTTEVHQGARFSSPDTVNEGPFIGHPHEESALIQIQGRLTNRGPFTAEDIGFTGPLEERVLFNDGGEMTLERVLSPMGFVKTQAKREERSKPLEEKTSHLTVKSGPFKTLTLDNKGQFFHAKGVSDIETLLNAGGYAAFDTLRLKNNPSLDGSLFARFCENSPDSALLNSLSILGSVSFETSKLNAKSLLVEYGPFRPGAGLNRFEQIDNEGIVVLGEGSTLQTNTLHNQNGSIESTTSLRLLALNPGQVPQTAHHKTPTLIVDTPFTGSRPKDAPFPATFYPGRLTAQDDLIVELSPAYDVFRCLDQFNGQWKQGRTFFLYGQDYRQTKDFQRGGHLLLGLYAFELLRWKLTTNALDLILETNPIIGEATPENGAMGQIWTVKDDKKTGVQDNRLSLTLKRGDLTLPYARLFGEGKTTLIAQNGGVSYGTHRLFDPLFLSNPTQHCKGACGAHDYSYQYHFKNHSLLASNSPIEVRAAPGHPITLAYTQVRGTDTLSLKAPLGVVTTFSSKLTLTHSITVDAAAYRHTRREVLRLFTCPDQRHGLRNGFKTTFQDVNDSDAAEISSLKGSIFLNVQKVTIEGGDLRAAQSILHNRGDLRDSSAFTNTPRYRSGYSYDEQYAGGLSLEQNYNEYWGRRITTVEEKGQILPGHIFSSNAEEQVHRGYLSAANIFLTGDSVSIETFLRVLRKVLKTPDGRGMIQAIVDQLAQNDGLLHKTDDGNLDYTVPLNDDLQQEFRKNRIDLPIEGNPGLSDSWQALAFYAPVDLQYEAFLKTYGALTGKAYLKSQTKGITKHLVGEDLLFGRILAGLYYQKQGLLTETRRREIPESVVYFKRMLNGQQKPCLVMEFYCPEQFRDGESGQGATLKGERIKFRFRGQGRFKAAVLEASGEDSVDGAALDVKLGSFKSEPIIERTQTNLGGGHHRTQDHLHKTTQMRSTGGSASILSEGLFHAVATKFMAAKKLTLGSENGDTILEPARLETILESWSSHTKEGKGPFSETVTETRARIERHQAFDLTEITGGEQVTVKAGPNHSIHYLIPKIQAGKEGIVFEAKQLALKGLIAKHTVSSSYNKKASNGYGGGVDRWDSSSSETPSYHEGQILTKGPLTFQNEQAEVDGCTVVALRGIIDKTRTLRFGCIKEEIKSYKTEGKQSYKGSAEADTSVKQDVVIQPQVFAPFMICEPDPLYDTSPLTAELVLESALFNIPVKVTLRKNLREEMVTVRYEEKSRSSAEGVANAPLKPPKILPQLPSNLDGKDLAAQMTAVMNELSTALNTSAKALNLMSGDLSALLGILEQYAVLEFSNQSSEVTLSQTQQLPNILNIGHLNIKAESWKHAGHAHIEFIIGELKAFAGEPITAHHKLNVTSESESTGCNVSSGSVSHSYTKKQHLSESKTHTASTLQGRVMDLKTVTLDALGTELSFDYCTLAADRVFLRSVLDEFIEICKEKTVTVSITPSPDPVAMMVSVASSIDYKNDLDAVITKKIGAKSSLTGTKHLDLLIGHLTRTQDVSIKGPEDLGTLAENAHQTIGGEILYAIPMPNDRALARQHGFDPDDIGMPNDSLLIGLMGAKTRGEALKDLLANKGREPIRKVVAPEIMIAFKEGTLPLPLRQSASYQQLEKTYDVAFADDEEEEAAKARRKARDPLLSAFEEKSQEFLSGVSKAYLDTLRNADLEAGEVLWGGDIELEQLADLYKLRITVHKPEGDSLVAHPPIGADGGEEVHLSLSPFLKEGKPRSKLTRKLLAFKTDPEIRKIVAQEIIQMIETPGSGLDLEGTPPGSLSFVEQVKARQEKMRPVYKRLMDEVQAYNLVHPGIWRTPYEILDLDPKRKDPLVEKVDKALEPYEKILSELRDWARLEDTYQFFIATYVANPAYGLLQRPLQERVKRTQQGVLDALAHLYQWDEDKPSPTEADFYRLAADNDPYTQNSPYYQNYDPRSKAKGEVPVDGNCLFQAIARAINGMDEASLLEVTRLRNAVADRLEDLLARIQRGERILPQPSKDNPRPVLRPLTPDDDPIRSCFARILAVQTPEQAEEARDDLPPSLLLDQALSLKQSFIDRLEQIDAEEKEAALTALEAWSLQESTFEDYLKGTVPLTDYTFPYSDIPEVTTTLQALCQIYELDLVLYQKNREGKLAPVYQAKGGDQVVHLLETPDDLDGSVFSKLKGSRHKVSIQKEDSEVIEETTEHIRKSHSLTKIFGIVRLGASAYNLHQAGQAFSEAVQRYQYQNAVYKDALEEGANQEEALQVSQEIGEVLEDISKTDKEVKSTQKKTRDKIKAKEEGIISAESTKDQKLDLTKGIYADLDSDGYTLIRDATLEHVKILEDQYQRLEEKESKGNFSQKARAFIHSAKEVIYEQIQDIKSNPVYYVRSLAEFIPLGVGTAAYAGNTGYDVAFGDKTLGEAGFDFGVDLTVSLIGGKALVLVKRGTVHAVKFAWKQGKGAAKGISEGIMEKVAGRGAAASKVSGSKKQVRFAEGKNTNPLEPFGKKPIKEMTDHELTENLANRAEKALGKGNGPLMGQKKHRYAEDLAKRYQKMTGERPDLVFEESYKGGKPLEKGMERKGSVKPDVYNKNTGEVFDYKFGNAKLKPDQIQRLQKQMPKETYGDLVNVTEIKPSLPLRK